ncbi:MAG: MBL fold metallo-hydrolase [Flavipsychrobacter sp.]|nr:MBL fold metallo-hydrolase [Flavipsychrobacter sp.]
MYIEQIYTGCLAQAAYYLEHNGEAAVVDPLRDVTAYVKKARERNATIKYIFETHFHADFVSGHLELAKATGATIVFGPTAKPEFFALTAKDEQEFTLGNVTIKVLHTPGHTMESCCYLLYNEKGEEAMLFTGDTLFLGDVGRPDLAQKAGLSQEELGGMLYDSLRNKILPLPDHVVIYPAHGAGSACGKNMSTEKYDTLGHQKQVNYALDPRLTKEEFIKEVTTGLTKPPQYFPHNVAINKKGYRSLDEIIRAAKPLTAEQFAAVTKAEETLILDTRPAPQFVKGHIPGSVNIGLDGDFAPWVGALVNDIEQAIAIVCEEGKEQEVVIRLTRVGYDNAIGYLEGGYSAWAEAGYPADTISCIDAEKLADLLEEKPVATLLDVRRKSEYDSEHVIGAENLPLNYINDRMDELDTDVTYFVYCAAGYRSVIFISILQARGLRNLVNINGGFNAIKRNGRLFLSKYQQPTTML